MVKKYEWRRKRSVYFVVQCPRIHSFRSEVECLDMQYIDVIVWNQSFQVFLSGLIWVDHSNLLFGMLSFVPSITPVNNNFSSIVVMSERKVTCRYSLHAFICFNSVTERFESNIVFIKCESLYRCFFKEKIWYFNLNIVFW